MAGEEPFGMIVYEIYIEDCRSRKRELIGVLPEKRRGVEKIDQKTIVRWYRTILGNDFDTNEISFVQRNV
jgi:hypothetical protein